MMRAAIAGAAALLALAAIALALPGYAPNPDGTDAVANGKLTIQGDGARAPLNLPVFAAHPSASTGDFYILHNGSQHALCFRGGSQPFCATATLTP